jgi:AraC family transcriptional regulator
MVKVEKLPDTTGIELNPARIVCGASILVVGLLERHSFETTRDIPAQWQRFMALYDEIAHKADSIPLGITTNMDDDGNFDYICGVEVSQFAAHPRGLVQLRIPSQTYAVFLHREHVSRIPATYSAVIKDWLPQHKRSAADRPTLERHLETFDPRTGLGGVEIWMPLKDIDAA